MEKTEELAELIIQMEVMAVAMEWAAAAVALEDQFLFPPL